MVLFVKSSRLILVVVLALISVSRIIPPTINNAVFSTDSWPLIRLTQLLLESPWIRVLSLSTYHAKYPLAVLFSLIYTEITSLDIYTFYAFLGAPLVTLALTILLYTLLSRVFEKLSSTLALLALLIYPSFALFTSAYLKEVYSYPLSLLLLLLTVLATRRSVWIVVFIVGLTLVLSHPLTPLIIVVSITTYIYIKLVERVKLGVIGSTKYGNLIVVSLTICTLYAVYTALVGPLYAFSLIDIVVLTAYGVVLYATYFILYADSRGFAVLTIALLMVAVFTYISLTEGIQVGLNIAFYGLPLLLLVTGLYKPRSLEGHVIVSLLLPVAVGVLYTLTYAKFLVTITHRFLNYLVYPLAVSLLMISRIKPRVVLILVILTLLVNSYVILHSVSAGKDPVLFYWRYTIADMTLRNYVEKYSITRLVSSVKYSYMLSGEVAGVSLDLISILRSCSSTSSVLLITSYEEFIYGLPLSPLHYVRLTTDLFECSSVVYSSLENYILVK